MRKKYLLLPLFSSPSAWFSSFSVCGKAVRSPQAAPQRGKCFYTDRGPSPHHRHLVGVRGHYEPFPQTNDAYDAATDTYNYRPCFQYVKPWIENADYAVANFETTLNGPPYSGYPQFSAPDALAADIKDTGFDLVTTANNHSMDKGTMAWSVPWTPWMPPAWPT